MNIWTLGDAVVDLLPLADMQFRACAGGAPVINKDKQAAFGCASFKPVVRGTINLNQFSEAVTPVIWADEPGACDVSKEPRAHQPSSIF